MSKWRKKPVVIEAEQFDPNKKPWPDGVMEKETYSDPADIGGRMKIGDYRIETLEGGHIVKPGDWIIIGVKGEKYPCKPDIFQETYEKVD